MDSQQVRSSKSILVAVTAASIITGAVACGSGSGGGVPVEEFRGRYWQAWCENWVECRAYRDMDTCLAANDFPFGYPVYSREAAVRAGAMRYDAEKGAACIEWARTWGCTNSGEPTRQEWTESCGTIFDGTRRIGESCLSGECGGDGYCDIPDSCSEACCLGVCTEGALELASISIGDACSNTYHCAFGSYCKGGTCQPLEGEGEPCTEIGPESCVTGLTCFSDDSIGGSSCQRLPGHGEWCTRPSYPASCDDYRDFCDPATLTCIEVRAIGEPCNTPGIWGECEDLGRCSPAGVCEELPTAIGQPCADFNYTCRGQLECGADGICAAPEAAVDCHAQ